MPVDPGYLQHAQHAAQAAAASSHGVYLGVVVPMAGAPEVVSLATLSDLGDWYDQAIAGDDYRGEYVAVLERGEIVAWGIGEGQSHGGPHIGADPDPWASTAASSPAAPVPAPVQQRPASAPPAPTPAPGPPAGTSAPARATTPAGFFDFLHAHPWASAALVAAGGVALATALAAALGPARTARGRFG